MERRRKGAGQFQYGITENIDHQRWPPSEAIRHPTEQERAQRPEGERQEIRLGNGALGDLEVCRNGGYTKNQDEVVEGIQRPAEETSGEGVTLPCGQGPEWGEEVHQ